MRRRDLLLSVGASAGLQPFGTAGAQSQRPVVGHLRLGSPGLMGGPDLFVEGLRALGYEDGKSLVIENRWAHGDITRYPRLAREVVERSPAVIVAPCGPSLLAIRDISRTVPVIAICADEKNFLGEVASLARPGGHTTGVTFLSPESIGKRVELLREVVPRLSRLAVLYQSDDPLDSHWHELERLQPVFGLSYQRLPVARAEDLEATFDALAGERAQAVLVFPTTRLFGETARIAELARKHRVPSMFEFAFQVEAGGLLSYGVSISEFFGKSIPLYVDKILKGAKPAELPIIQPTRFELVVNLRTARALALTVPPSILVRADRVIE
jgi:putative ABC transport system substrate-binding protein